VTYNNQTVNVSMLALSAPIRLSQRSSYLDTGSKIFG